MTKSLKNHKISQKSQAVLDKFSEAAMHHGYQRNEGVGEAVNKAEQSYNEAMLAAVKLITKLEYDNAKLKKALAESRDPHYQV